MNAIQENPWIACYTPNPTARLRLFCFPYGGGGASIYRTWTHRLPPEIEVCPVQLPGRENRQREQPYTRLAPLVEVLAKELPFGALPFAFFGHSLGALISFELTRTLQQQNQAGPCHLFVSGHPAPQLADPDPPIHNLPDAAFIERIRRYNGTPEVILQDPELRELFLGILRADFAVSETYVYEGQAPVGCPITGFGGTEDWKAGRDALAGWEEQTRHSFAIRMFPGDHFFLQSARDTLLEAIGREIRRLMQ